MKIIKSCARILARARFVPRRLSSGRDRNFSTVLPSGFDIFGTRAASSSASGSTSKYNRANICPRREATAERSVARPRYFGLFSIHTAPPPSYLPYQHPVRIQRINLWLPAECLPSRRAEQAGLLLRGAWRPRDGNRVSCG